MLLQVNLDDTLTIADDDEVYAAPSESFCGRMFAYNTYKDTLSGVIIVDSELEYTHWGIHVNFLCFSLSIYRIYRKRRFI
jgi:hypothetical protein